ncbi:MAG TPA: sugar phosphate isomerase/epimerase [Bryobacteraceae bacterium]|nr:sugar phosphate isomerase/epimerase [Bryobacteraceae bacterium]
MSFHPSRRTFLGSAALATRLPAFSAPAQKPGRLKLGICSYSYTNRIKLPEVIQSVKTLGTRYINIKPEFHLPYESTREQISTARKMLDDAGLILAGTGTTYLQTVDEAQIRQRFEFNKTLGSPLIVIGPTAETLPIIEKYVKEYDIKVAVHNHGPSDKYFPTPQSALKVIRNMDPRVGLCIDIGHTLRAGVNPVEAAKLAGPRLLDMHTKDVRKESNGKWVAVDVGEGDMPLAELFRLLEKMGYPGYCNLEYEVSTQDRMLGIQKSFYYMRGVVAGLAA